MLGSVYYCCGKIPGQIDGRSGKNTSGCIEGFWRLAIKRIRGFSLAKTAESLRKNQLARSLMCFFHGSPSRFLLFITLTPQILLLGYLLTKVSIFYILNIHFFWCGTQAVRDWSAKPSLVGSTPIHTFSGEFLQSRRTPKG